MNGTWRARGLAAWAGRGLCLVALGSLLGGCSLFGGETAGEKAAANQSYPNLGTVPTQAPATSSPADRQQISQGLVADQQNAAYSDQKLKAQPTTGTTPPPAPQPAPTMAEASAGTATGAAATTASAGGETAPAASTSTAPVEQSTLPPPPAVGGQTTATAPAAAPTQTAAATAAPTQMAAAPAAQPPAAAPQPASPYYPLPVSGAPPPVTPAAAPAASLPAPDKPVIVDQARLESLLQTVQGPYAGTPGAQRQGADNRPPPIAVIFFADGSAALSERDYAVLHDVVLLQEQQGGQLRVIGHASERSATMDYAQHEAVNDNLSMKRASAVGRALMRMGAPMSQVAISAVGDQQPIFYEFMPTGEAGNRRVEIFLDR